MNFFANNGEQEEGTERGVVKLTSCDSEEFEISIPVAKQSILINDLLDGKKND